MPLSRNWRYLAAFIFLAYGLAKIWERTVVPVELAPEFLDNRLWLYGITGWFVASFAGMMMSPSLISLFYTLKNRKQLDNNIYVKEPVTEIEALPEDLKAWEEQLEILDFSPFGMYRAEHKTKPEMNYKVWVYVNSARDIYADVVQFANGTSAIEFGTEFADGFQVGTLYNLALNVDSEIIYCRSFKGSIREAHDYHAYQVDLRAEEHGDILKPDTVADYLHTPERDREFNRAISDSLIRDNKNVVMTYLWYILPAPIFALLPLVIPAYIADILFAFTMVLVFVFVDTMSLKLSYVTVDDTRKLVG